MKKSTNNKCWRECEQKGTLLYTTEYYSVIKNNEILPFAAMQIDLEIIKLNEVRQGKHYMILYVESKKQDTNEFIYKQKQTHRHRKQTCLPKWKEAGDKLEVWDWQIYTTIYKLGKQQGLTVQHRELYSICCNKL